MDTLLSCCCLYINCIKIFSDRNKSGSVSSILTKLQLNFSTMPYNTPIAFNIR